MDLSTADVFNRTAAIPHGRGIIQAAHMNQTNIGKFTNSQYGTTHGVMMPFGSGGSSPSLYSSVQASMMQAHQNKQSLNLNKYGSQALSDGRPSFIKNVKSKLEKIN